MTIERLEQYKKLSKEIEMYKARLERLEQRATDIVHDVVAGSSSMFPYVKHPVVVKGMDVRLPDRCARISRIIKRRVELLLKEQEAIEEWLDTVKESAVRQIVTYYYIEDYTWPATARRVYGHPCGDAARMRLKRYLEKYPECS
ncbi:MAG TPA: hypothetical protein PKB13_07500 [Clostridia bacterium]|nr:hypothetical protein [Clostridia bacterium]